MNSKQQARRKLIIEGIFAVLVALSPIFFYLYKYVPASEGEISILGINFGPNGFDETQMAFYYYCTKLVPLILLVIWFVTTKQWWYHAILIPIAMFSFQLFNVITYEKGMVDENEILYVVAVSMVVIPVVYFIRIKLVDKYVHGIDLKAMDTELQILKAKEELRKEREKLEQRKETLSKRM